MWASRCQRSSGLRWTPVPWRTAGAALLRESGERTRPRDAVVGASPADLLRAEAIRRGRQLCTRRRSALPNQGPCTTSSEPSSAQKARPNPLCRLSTHDEALQNLRDSLKKARSITSPDVSAHIRRRAETFVGRGPPLEENRFTRSPESTWSPESAEKCSPPGSN